MAKKGRIVLKTYFETDDIPTEDEFADSIDSPVNIKDDIENGTDKATPVDADKFSLWDSVDSALKTLTWANLAAAVGGGGEYQDYADSFMVDATSGVNWIGSNINNGGALKEYNVNTGIALTNSMLTGTGTTFSQKGLIGIAKGAQKIEYLRLHFGYRRSAMTDISIMKMRLSGINNDTIDSIAVLYEGAINLDSTGDMEILAAAFTEIQLTDYDLIYLFFGSGTTLDVGPCYYKLKCILD